MMNVYVVEDIPVNSSYVPLHDYEHLYDLPVDSAAQQVDLLIGQDVAEALIPLETRRGRQGEPFAVRTLLGWSINGPVSCRAVSKKVIANFVTASSLESQVKVLWEIENDNARTEVATWSSCYGSGSMNMQLWAT